MTQTEKCDISHQRMGKATKVLKVLHDDLTTIRKRECRKCERIYYTIEQAVTVYDGERARASDDLHMMKIRAEAAEAGLWAIGNAEKTKTMVLHEHSQRMQQLETPAEEFSNDQLEEPS